MTDINADEFIVDLSADIDNGGVADVKPARKGRGDRRPYWFYTDSLDKGVYSFDEKSEGEYSQYSIGQHYSYFKDTVLLANELNYHHCPVNRWHYDFLFHILKHRKRWYPAENKRRSEIDRIDEICDFLQMSPQKVAEISNVLTDVQWVDLVSQLDRGGKSK